MTFAPATPLITVSGACTRRMESCCYVMNDSGRCQDSIDNQRGEWGEAKRGVGWKMTAWKMMIAKRKSERREIRLSGGGRGVEMKPGGLFLHLLTSITLVWHGKVTRRRQGNHIDRPSPATGIPTFNSLAHLFLSNPSEANLRSPVSHPYSVLQL